MFPGPNAQIHRNEAGEPIDWDYPSDPTTATRAASPTSAIAPTTTMTTRTRKMPDFKLIDPETGVEVIPGDPIVDFRDHLWYFHHISRNPGWTGIDHSNGKITVLPSKSSNQTEAQEFYPSVFDLKIVPSNPEQKGSTNMTTVRQLRDQLNECPMDAVVILQIVMDRGDPDREGSMVCSGDITIDSSGFANGECILDGDDDS